MQENPKEKDILYQLINYERNRDLLEYVPHIRYLDMAIVFYYWQQEDDHTKGICLVSNAQMRMWGSTPESLERLAAHNTPRSQPVSFQPIGEIIRELFGLEFSISMEDGETEIPMHVLTNKSKLFGAAAILYPQVLWAVSQSLNEDIYILPSSIHEVIIVPVSVRCSRAELEHIVGDINHSQLPEREILSDHVYLYRKKEDFLGL